MHSYLLIIYDELLNKYTNNYSGIPANIPIAESLLYSQISSLEIHPEHVLGTSSSQSPKFNQSGLSWILD